MSWLQICFHTYRAPNEKNNLYLELQQLGIDRTRALLY